MPCLKRGHQPGKRLAAGRRGEPDPQLPGDRSGSRACIVEGLGEPGVRRLELGVQLLAERREPDAAVGPVEQCAARPPLQAGDEPAHLWLGQAQPPGGAAKVQLAG
jgi:hypothetical protein